MEAAAKQDDNCSQEEEEEVVLPGHATGMEEADEDESDDAEDGSQEDVAYPPGRSIIRMAMGHFGPNRNWDPALRLGNQPEEDMEEEDESGEEEESESEDDDENVESADDRNDNDEDEDDESADEGPVPALQFQPKFATPPAAADSDSDVICLSSDDEDGQEKLREASTGESGALEASTEGPSSDHTTPMNSTPMNSTMEEEEEEEGESSAEFNNSTVEVNSTVEINSTVEVQSSGVLDSSAESGAAAGEERGSSPIPNLDGAFDLLHSGKAPAPPRKFFNPLEHLPWCTWVRPTSFDQGPNSIETFLA